MTEDMTNQIICEDVIDGLSRIPSNSVHVVFTSPPYCCGIKYGSHNDNMPWSEYLDWLKQVWDGCCRTLVAGGRLVINIDSITNRQDPIGDREYIRPIHAELIEQMRNIDGMMYRTEIAWCKHQVVGRATAWGSYMSCSNPVIRRNHEHLYIWSKGQWKLPGDPKMSDITAAEFQMWTMSTWFIQPETRNLGGHPVPFPKELAHRVIKLYSYKGNTILDPFSGVGTTLLAANMLGRKYIGIDIDPDYCKYAKWRVEEKNKDLLA